MTTKKTPHKAGPDKAGVKGKSAADNTPTRVIELKLGRDSATVKASVFKAKCLDIMDEVQQRHISVVVTKHGTPVAKLGPVDDTPPNPFGFLRGTVVSDHALVDAEHDAWTESDSDPLG
jgi:prevent-host-death family protein